MPEQFRRESLDDHPHVKRCLLEREPVWLSDWRQGQLTDAERAVCEARGLRSLLYVPVVVGEESVGALIVGSVGRLHDVGESDVDVCGALSHEIGLALANARLHESLRRSHEELAAAYDATLEGWSLAQEMRDDETQGHALRVSAAAVELGRALGLSAEDLVHVRRGALLHDIGKMVVPDAILHKVGPLTEEEWTVMRQHPVNGRDFLKRIEYLAPALDIPDPPPRAVGRLGVPARHQRRSDPPGGPPLRRGRRLRRTHLGPPLQACVVAAAGARLHPGRGRDALRPEGGRCLRAPRDLSFLFACPRADDREDPTRVHHELRGRRPFPATLQDRMNPAGAVRSTGTMPRRPQEPAAEQRLARYRAKRSADRTPEPFGGEAVPTVPVAAVVRAESHVESAPGPAWARPRLFCVQKHAARAAALRPAARVGGVLRSWAVPKGPSLDPNEKRLAVEVEDHPIEYADFEGVIPEGNYGAGEMIVWDRGVSFRSRTRTRRCRRAS